MATDTEALMRKAREILNGKWGLPIGVFFVYSLLTGAMGSLPGGGSIIALLFGGPFELGAAMFALSIARGEEPEFVLIFQGFNFFVTAMATYLLIGLFVLLWSLLLIIPGIIAAYSYSMCFYILADDPSLKPMEILDRSKKMMDGHKWDLFGLSMWFFLLSLCCLLTCGIGFLWLIPYMHVTTALFYEEIKGQVMISPVE